ALAALFLGLGSWFRLHLVHEWNTPAVDGKQYLALAQQLLAHRRFAFGPSPLPLLYTRLPGYPLFLCGLSWLAPHHSVTLEQGTALATSANAMLDVGTALFVLLLLREVLSGAGR